MFIVRFIHKTDGDSLFAGPPGLCMNGGGLLPSVSVCFRKDARRFASEAEARRFAKCNDQWRAAVEKEKE